MATFNLFWFDHLLYKLHCVHLILRLNNTQVDQVDYFVFRFIRKLQTWLNKRSISEHQQHIRGVKLFFMLLIMLFYFELHLFNYFFKLVTNLWGQIFFLCQWGGYCLKLSWRYKFLIAWWRHGLQLALNIYFVFCYQSLFQESVGFETPFALAAALRNSWSFASPYIVCP